MVNRFPAAGAIYSAAGLSVEYSAVVGGASPGATANIQVVAASNAGTCNFVYTEAQTISAVPTLGAVNTAGC